MKSDITCIRLRDEFVYLAVVLDAFSRRVIGWALDRTMEESLTLSALQMALSRRIVEPGGSMSRKGNPWDNAACEPFDMIAVANQAGDGWNCGEGPQNGLNENWLPFVDNYRTFLADTGMLDLERLAKLAA